jgi:hypothetical protein
MFVGGIVVEDDMDRLVGRNLALDGIEKANEFEVTVALHAAANDGAVEHAERREQRGGAVPLVVVRHRLAAPGLDRQSRLGAVECLDLAFLVDRQHHRMSRRIEVEPDDVGQLGGKARIARALEGAQPVRLQLVCPPDALHRTQRDADRLGHRPAGPMGRLVRRFGAKPALAKAGVSATTRAVISAAIGALPGLRVLSRSKPSTPLSAKRCCHRHTVGRLTPTLCAICCAGCRSAEASTMRARSACLRGRLRSAVIAVNCSRSAALNTTHTSCAMVPIPQPRRNIAHFDSFVYLFCESEH